MGDFNFSNNVTGGNAQINQGQNVTATQTNTGGDLDLNALFQTLISDVPEAKESFEVLKVEAEKPEPDIKVAEKEKDKLQPLGEKIGKVCGKLGWATVKGLLKSNPIGAVILEVSEAFAEDK